MHPYNHQLSNIILMSLHDTQIDFCSDLFVSSLRPKEVSHSPCSSRPTSEGHYPGLIPQFLSTASTDNGGFPHSGATPTQMETR